MLPGDPTSLTHITGLLLGATASIGHFTCGCFTAGQMQEESIRLCVFCVCVCVFACCVCIVCACVCVCVCVCV